MRGVLALALVALSAACAAGATAAPGLKLGITDSGNAYFSPPASFYPDLGRLHAKVLRVHLNWGGKLGVATRRPVDGADPSDPAYNWSRYDEIVLRAADQHVQVLFTIFGSPAWANGGQLPTRAPHRAADLVDFSFAAAQRYGGEFMRDDGTVLPRVRYWTAWNEPNLPIGLVPQWKRVGEHWVIQSAIDYARICNAVVDGVRGTLIPGEKIACGDTGPARQQRTAERTADDLADRVPAGDEARRRRRLRRLRSPSVSERPVGDTDDATDRLDGGHVRQPRHARLRGDRLYGHKAIWLDEYGYQTNPPDDDLGVTPAKQARYLTQSVALARENPRVTMLLWFLVRDEHRLIGWQSGLETWDGKRKPAFAAFQRAANLLAHAEQQREQRLLHVQAVLRLVPDRRARRRRARSGVISSPGMRRQAVQDDRVGGREREQRLVEPVGLEVAQPLRRALPPGRC